MSRRNVVWIGLAAAAAGLTVMERVFPYLPGDVTLARWMQSALPTAKSWAGYLSSTAKLPWLLILVGVTACLSWAIAAWRAAALSLVSIAGMWLLGMWLGPLIAQPRPSGDLIRVVGSHTGSAFPSQTALRYAATLGFLAALAALRGSGVVRWGAIVICSMLLVSAAAARVAVGAHWPSDIVLSYLIAFLWIDLLLQCVPGEAPGGAQVEELGD
jgi:membrane-associated phospholipid phosphatase